MSDTKKKSIIRNLNKNIFIDITMLLLLSLLIFVSIEIVRHTQTILFGYISERQTLQNLDSLISDTEKDLLKLIAITKEKEKEGLDTAILHILAHSENFQSAFDSYQDAAAKRNSISEISVIKEYEPVLTKIRSDIVKVAYFYKKHKHSEARSFYSKNLAFRNIQFKRFINDSLDSLDLLIKYNKKKLCYYESYTSLFSFVITLLISFFIYIHNTRLIKAITTPIHLLTLGIQRISAGDYEYKIKMNKHTHDEFGMLCETLNTMSTKIDHARKSLLAEQKFALDQHCIVITFDLKGTITSVNQKFCDVSGYNEDELIGHSHHLLISQNKDKAYRQKMYQTITKGKVWQDEACFESKNDGLYWLETTLVPFMNEEGILERYIAISTDITHSKKQQEALELMAHYDVLTRLPNRTLLVDRFTQAISRSKRKETLLAVCFIDLDKFKPVNDLYGHKTGDQLLIEVAGRIKANIRIGDTASRHGGDEFILLLTDMESLSQCKEMLKRITEALAQPFSINNHVLSISASIGVSLYPIDNSDLDTLMRHADQAMYQAKLAGRNCYHFFDIEKDYVSSQKHVRLKEIQQALLNNEFCLYYQPKVNMATGGVFGAEALIRWNHPEKGLIPPLDIFPIIKETKLEIQIGNWIINEALKQLNSWVEQGLKIEVSINISSYYLQTPSFVTDLEAALTLFPKVSSKYLQLEVLESSALGDLQSISSTINTCISELGVNVALDDFGTGYSSLTHLRNLSAHTIKIDRSFVRDILDDPSDYAIIDGVIGLAKSFNRNVIAEGVETTEHGLMLLTMGCNEAQGYAIARPLPAPDFPEWLTNYVPNQEWLTYANKTYSQKEAKIKLFKMCLSRWQKCFENNIQSTTGNIEQWPILKKTNCHCGIWIKQEKQEQLFEKNWLKDLDMAHKAMHDIADELFKKNQENEIENARAGLKDLQTAFKHIREACVVDLI